MECNYDRCPAKIHIDTVTKRLNDGSAEFEDMRKEAREQAKRIGEIANNQTKISADLILHMSRSEDKHNLLVELLKSFDKKLDNHTDNEMAVQENNNKAISELTQTVSSNTKTLKYIVYGITGVALFLWDYIKLLLDAILKPIFGL